MKETLQSNFLNFNKPDAEPPSAFPHAGLPRDDQLKFAKVAQSSQKEYLGINSVSRRANESKKMSNFIDKCLLPIVTQPIQSQANKVGTDTAIVRSRNRLTVADTSEAIANQYRSAQN